VTLVWACVLISWSSPGGEFAGYYVGVDGVGIAAVLRTGGRVRNEWEFCPIEKYHAFELRIAAYPQSGNHGPWSDPLFVQRIHNFDANGSGATDGGDFGAFVNAWGSSAPAFDADGDGVVGGGDWSAFVTAFGCEYLESGIAVCL